MQTYWYHHFLSHQVNLCLQRTFLEFNFYKESILLFGIIV